MKIAMLGHKRIPSREGGVEIVVKELGTRMVRLGHQVTCFNRREHHVNRKGYGRCNLHEYKGVRIRPVPTVTGKGMAAVSSSFFASIFAAFGRFDVVHFHAEGPCAMLWIPRLLGRRCIATVHGLDWKRQKWGAFARNYIRFGEKIAVKYADEIIVLSRGAKEYFLREYGRETVLIPNGVDRHRKIEAEQINQLFGLKKDEYILFLGRVVPEKGIRYLIEAFRTVHTEKKLVIAGGSSDSQAFMKEMQRLAGGDSRIRFTGFVRGRVLAELFSNAYVYCLPSDLEGMPLSLLEAMSYGCCCLTSDIPECADVVEDRALTFRKGSVDDLREKLQFLCDHPDVVGQYKSEVADYICGRFDWDTTVKKTLEIYRR